MSETITQNNIQVGNKLLWRVVMILFLVITGIGLSGQIAQWAVSSGIEWVSVTDLGMIVIGVWGMLSAGIAETLTDRVFKHLSKNSVEV